MLRSHYALKQPENVQNQSESFQNQPESAQNHTFEYDPIGSYCSTAAILAQVFVRVAAGKEQIGIRVLLGLLGALPMDLMNSYGESLVLVHPRSLASWGDCQQKFF